MTTRVYENSAFFERVFIHWPKGQLTYNVPKRTRDKQFLFYSSRLFTYILDKFWIMVKKYIVFSQRVYEITLHRYIFNFIASCCILNSFNQHFLEISMAMLEDVDWLISPTMSPGGRIKVLKVYLKRKKTTLVVGANTGHWWLVVLLRIHIYPPHICLNK